MGVPHEWVDLLTEEILHIRGLTLSHGLLNPQPTLCIG